MVTSAATGFRLWEQLARRAPRLEPQQCRRIRLRADVTLQQIAAELGVNLSTVWRWEQGIQRPQDARADRYYALLAYLATLPAPRFRTATRRPRQGGAA